MKPYGELPILDHQIRKNVQTSIYKILHSILCTVYDNYLKVFHSFLKQYHHLSLEK